MQLSMDLSRFLGEIAAEHCTSNAEIVTGFDRIGAAKFIEGHLRRFGPTSGEDCTDAAVEHGFHTHDRRAFGAVYARLVKEKRIKCVGFCMRRNGHGTAGGRVWAAT